MEKTTASLVKEAQYALERLNSAHDQTWADWVVIGEALVAGRHDVMAKLGITHPTGHTYKGIR